MSLFTCRSRSASGAVVDREVEAESKLEAKAILERDGLIPVKIVESRTSAKGTKSGKRSGDGDAPPRKSGTRSRKVKRKELMRFTFQLGSSIHAGVPILSAIESISRQVKNPGFRDVLIDVTADIHSGLALSAAMAKHPKVFDEIYVNTIAAGEKSGTLSEVMDNLSDQIEEEIEIRSDVRSALMYPGIVISMLVLAIGVLVIFVVPRFGEFYAGFKTELPLPTRVLIGTSTFLKEYFLIVAAAGAAMMFGFVQFLRTPLGRRLFDRFLLRIPVIGGIIESAVTLRVIQMIALFSKAGVPLLEGLETISRAVANTKFRADLVVVADSVASGESLAKSMEDAECLPVEARQMISNGEMTGSLEQSCFSVARHYKKELHYQTKNLATLIEPILTLVLAVVVVFVALATFLPMWDLAKVVKN